MALVKKSESVPKAMQAKYQAIVEITDSFSEENLNDDYAQLIRYAVAAVCRKRPAPAACPRYPKQDVYRNFRYGPDNRLDLALG